MRENGAFLQRILNNAHKGRDGTVTEIFYEPLHNAGKIISERYPSYKILLIAGGAYGVGLTKYLPDNTLSVIWNGTEDVRALFSFPDTVTLAVAFGDERVIEGARYFASVRGIKCVALVTDFSGRGILSENVGICLLEKSVTYPAAFPEIIFLDENSARKDSLKYAFSSLAACSAALVEKKFDLLVLGGAEDDELYELAFDNYLSLTDTLNALNPAKSIFCRCLAAEYLRSKGFYDTESGYLFKNILPEYRLSAFNKFIGVVCAFFSLGGRRKIALPNYAERIKDAAIIGGESELAVSGRTYIPDALTLDRFFVSFGENRNRLLSFALDIRGREQSILDAYCRLGGVVCEAQLSRTLFALPELSGKYGVISLMRDFGLLEKN